MKASNSLEFRELSSELQLLKEFLTSVMTVIAIVSDFTVVILKKCDGRLEHSRFVHLSAVG